MKITLIKPNIGRREHSLYVDEARMEPLQLGIIGGMIPPDIEVVLYDDRIETIPYDEPTDLVGITVETFTARRAYEISEQYRKRGIPVVMGGMHPTLIPDEVLKHADAICIGDAETTWPQVIRDAHEGVLQRIYERTSITGLVQSGFFPARHLYRGKGYLPISLIQFSRGCVYDCEFCATSVYSQKNHRCRAVEDVIAEITGQNLKLLFFVDDNIIANPDAAKKLFRALIPLKIKWVSQASLDMTADPELMELMMKSGCLGNVVGFESILLENLHLMNKQANINGFDNYRRQLDIIRNYGMQLWAAFTIGYDNDTVASINDTLAFAVDNKFCFAAFNILMPYPNTPLYAKLEHEKRLLYDGRWWLHPEYRFNYASYLPGKMSPDELTQAAFNARAKFNGISSIIKRAFDFKTNMRSLYRLGIYLAYNPLFRKEVFKKQGLRFGLSGKNYLKNE